MKKAMTQQEIFDKVLFGIREQGGLHYTLVSGDGKPLKSVVGHLIPDADYLQEVEGESIQFIQKLVGRLQREHESSAAQITRLLSRWEEEMRGIAFYYRFHYTEPKQS